MVHRAENLIGEGNDISHLLKSVGESGKEVMKKIASEEKKLTLDGSRHTIFQKVFGGYVRAQWRRDIRSLENAKAALRHNIDPIIEVNNMITRVGLYLVNFKVGDLLC
jgi:hypothetical protein